MLQKHILSANLSASELKPPVTAMFHKVDYQVVKLFIFDATTELKEVMNSDKEEGKIDENRIILHPQLENLQENMIQMHKRIKGKYGSDNE